MFFPHMSFRVHPILLQHLCTTSFIFFLAGALCLRSGAATADWSPSWDLNCDEFLSSSDRYTLMSQRESVAHNWARHIFLLFTWQKNKLISTVVKCTSIYMNNIWQHKLTVDKFWNFKVRSPSYINIENMTYNPPSTSKSFREFQLCSTSIKWHLSNKGPYSKRRYRSNMDSICSCYSQTKFHIRSHIQ